MSEKINWSKLSEMPPYAPTGEGWHQLANGFIGYVQGPDPNNSPWKIRLCKGHAMFYRNDGTLFSNSIFGSCEDWRIVKYLGDVLPWEECGRLKDECSNLREFWAWEKSQNSKLSHGYVLLKQQRDQYESELRAEQELNRKWAIAYDAMKAECEQQVKQLEAERDKLQNQIVEMLGDYKTLKAKHDVLDAGMRASSIVTLLEREKKLTGYIETLQERVVQSLSQISDLQQRMEKLEEFHKRFTNPVDCYTTMPQEIEPFTAVTDKVQAEKEVV